MAAFLETFAESLQNLCCCADYPPPTRPALEPQPFVPVAPISPAPLFTETACQTEESSEGCFLEAQPSSIGFAVSVAVRANNLRAVRQLLSLEGADVNEVESDGCTPLLAACSQHHPQEELIDCLLQCGADPNAADSEGATPLQSVASSGSLTCLELLLASGAKVDSLDGEGCSALYLACGNACSQGHLDCIRALLDAKADVSQTAADGSTVQSISDELDEPYRQQVFTLLGQYEVPTQPEQSASSKEKSMPNFAVAVAG